MEWGGILAEEVGELCKELNDVRNDAMMTTAAEQRIYSEAIQVAAVAVNIIEHLCRNLTAINAGHRREGGKQ
jgi:hypothetical protein